MDKTSLLVIDLIIFPLNFHPKVVKEAENERKWPLFAIKVLIYILIKSSAQFQRNFDEKTNLWAYSLDVYEDK